jgi:hypothetical protein
MKRSRWLFVLSVAWFFGTLGIILCGIFLSHWTHHVLQAFEGDIVMLSDLKWRRVIKL